MIDHDLESLGSQRHPVVDTPDNHVKHVFLVSSVRRAISFKLRGPGFKSQPGTVGGSVTIIMWGAQPG